MRPRENEPGEPRAAGAGTGADPRTAGMTGSTGSGGTTGTAGASAAGRTGSSTNTGTGSPSRERALPAPGFAEVSIVAATSEAARRIAQVLRFRFAATEQPGGLGEEHEDGGTRLRLTVDTVHFPDAGPFQLRLVGGEDHTRTATGVTEVADATAGDTGETDGTGVSGPTTGADGVTPPDNVTPPARPPRPAPNTRFAQPPTPDDPSGDRPTS